MLTAVDHIIVRVSDLTTAVDTFRRLGFTLSDIRSEEGEGVAYAAFGDFHLEFRETTDPSAREGLHALALRSDDIDADVARLMAVGLPVTDPRDDTVVALPRRSADVEAFIPMRLVERGYDNGALHKALGCLGSHPNTATALERTYVAVESIAEELHTVEQVLGIRAPEPEMGTVIMSLMSVFYLGGIGIAVAEPRGLGPTADALAANGPGMFQTLFHAEHLDEAERFMVSHDIPPPQRGTRLSGESALLVTPEHACGVYVAMAGHP